jgi:DNA-binding CsgD family transcriptional regulator
MKTRETILDMWSKGHCADDIAAIAGIDRRNLFQHLRMARALGDARADRRSERVKATDRRKSIAAMVSVGKSKSAIARALGVSKRLVEIRLKEMTS